MKVVIQRVNHASVSIKEEVVGTIAEGMLVLVGIVAEDTNEDIKWLSNKLINLRIFDDEEALPNKSILEMGGEILLISQFTLHARTKKGNRPSYIDAARPEISIPIYEKIIKQLEFDLGKEIQTGRFGQQMKVVLENQGPVTIIIDTKDKK